jgi:hypothetical protein
MFDPLTWTVVLEDGTISGNLTREYRCAQAYWGVLVERVEAAVSNEGRGWDGPVASSVEAVASLAARAILVPSIAPEVPRMLTMMGNINGETHIICMPTR